jgi:DnaK suppressor protein
MTGGPPPDGVRERLERELREALEQAGATARAIDSVMASGCRLDGVGAAAVDAALPGAGDRARRRVAALAAALDRADRGVYGACEACGASIDAERLTLLPAATRCRDCVP